MKTIKIFAYALVATSGVLLTSCGSDDSGSSLPPIGGYNSANDVGASDLVAYWPLDGDGKESKSGQVPSGSAGVSFSDAVKGKGADFNMGYLNYPVIPSLASINGSITISLWAKVSNNATNPTMLFSLSAPQDGTHDAWNGAANILAETGRGNRPITADTLQVKGLFNILKPDGTSFGGDAVNAEQLSPDDIANGGVVHVNKTAGQWMHVVYVFDGSTAKNMIYVNGQKISNPQWEERNKINGVNVGVPFRAYANSHPIIGTFGSILTGNSDTWQQHMKGSVDEVRVWKKVVSAADINSLYELESAGR